MKKLVIAVLLASASTLAVAAPLADTNYVDNKVNTLRSETHDIRDKAYRGVASVAAMTNIPTVPGKTLSIGVGVGAYGSDSALATGLTFTPDDTAAIKASAAINGEEFTYGLGMSFGF